MKYVVVFFIFILFFFSCYQDNKKQPSAVKGILDLRSWNFKNDKSVPLKGEWNFYWKQFLLNKKDFSSARQTGFFLMPGLWNGLIVDGKKIGGSGYASFELTVLLKKDHLPLAVKIGEMKSAYQLFVNDELLASAGTIGENINSSIPDWKSQIIKISPEKIKLHIVINISNFHYYKGGPHRVPVIGLEKEIEIQQVKYLILEIFLFGSLFIMALYHLILYFSNRKEPATLYFSLFCFVISIYLITTGEIIMKSLVPWLSWECIVKIIFFSIYVSVPLFFLYLKSIYLGKFLNNFLKLNFFIIALLLLSVIFAPVNIFSYTLKFFHIIVVLSSLYVFYTIFSSKEKMNRMMWIFTIGIFIFFLSILNDILYHEEVLATGDMTPAGVFFMILFHGYVISERIRKTGFKDEKKDLIIIEKREEQLDFIVDFIKENYMEDLSREGLASKIDMHPDNFGRYFKKHTGKKFGDMINELRISQSIESLINTNITILEIALSTGFENLRTFNRIFLKITGMTPGNYRKKHTASE